MNRAAIVRKDDRIVDEVGDRDLDQARIADDHEAGALTIESEIDLTRIRQRLATRHHFFDYATAPSIQFDATSLSAGLFLFGAKPSFSQKTGSWTKTRVASPVTDGGPGAVELLMRWEDVDLGVPTVGGDGGAFTLGANWYLSDFSRLMLNVIRWNTENRSGSYLGEDEGTSIVARAQVSF